jgi:hypothetical protein
LTVSRFLVGLAGILRCDSRVARCRDSSLSVPNRISIPAARLFDSSGAVSVSCCTSPQCCSRSSRSPRSRLYSGELSDRHTWPIWSEGAWFTATNWRFRCGSVTACLAPVGQPQDSRATLLISGNNRSAVVVAMLVSVTADVRAAAESSVGLVRRRAQQRQDLPSSSRHPRFSVWESSRLGQTPVELATGRWIECCRGVLAYPTIACDSGHIGIE